MNLLTHMRKPSLWMKTFTAALLTLFMLTSTIQAASAAADGSTGQPTELNAENAAAFLEEFFASESAKPQYTGASVVIVKDGQVVAQKGYGYADQAKETAVDPASTVFRIASVSKTFTAVAIMQLVEQGKISLQDDFRKYVANLSFDNPFDKPVTIEHLLTHTTGFEIRDPQAGDIHNDLDKVVEIEDYVRANMPPVVREPGSSYMYDNFGSLLLGLIVQEVSGMPYKTYMESKVFQPLGMGNSGFLLEGALKDNLAVGYDAAGQPIDLYTLTPTVMPHGGMLSTAEDIGKFMIAFLNGGAAGANRLLSENAVGQMEQYRSSIHPLLPDTTYGFEAPFQLPGAGSSSRIITKGGDLPGFSSYLFLIPEQNTGVFLTYNKTSVLRNLFYPQFIEKFFPQYAAPAALEPFEPQSAGELGKFDGYYADLRLSSLVSSLNKEDAGGLVISDAYIGPRPLQQVDENLFVDQLSKQFTAFKLDGNGNVLYMKEPYLNPFSYAEKGVQPAGFADVNASHPYGKYILALQSLGYYPNDATEEFMPEQPLTRGEFVQDMLVMSNLKGSSSTELAFADLEGHPAAAFIQMAHELGMVKGGSSGLFEPDRVITRQEAAVMLWRLYSLQYSPELFSGVKLGGDTSAWAVQAVQMMVALGIHGPEVQADSGGAVDFLSKQALSRQEEAAIAYSLFTQPTDQIVAELMKQQTGEAAEAAEGTEGAEGVEEQEAEAAEASEAM
ncbi:serine hydrolase [Paenibacillus harenae]|uniref:serine hydrolase n=1 Tax=Paenibacillus harenae TaxID=306543 RepID=UPI0003F9F5B2|nr:serine hydrolase [Paenibacillus harenae]